MTFTHPSDEWLRVASEQLAVEIQRVVRIDEGWQCVVFELNGAWIVRVPRDVETEELLRRETTLLAELAPALPVATPRLRLLHAARRPIVAYEKIVGERIDQALGAAADADALGGDLGAFLAGLHSFPSERAVAAGAAAATVNSWLDERRAFADRCSRDVYPLLDVGERRRAATIFDTYFATLGDEPELRLIHADVGPAHLLCNGSTLNGVIDWSGAQIGDPALDLAWPVHGAGDRLGAAVRASYRPASDAFYERALACHRLGPWYEVLHGLDRREPRFVASGLQGVRVRLPD